jgi:two-component system cell cycle response regulator
MPKLTFLHLSRNLRADLAKLAPLLSPLLWLLAVPVFSSSVDLPYAVFFRVLASLGWTAFFVKEAHERLRTEAHLPVSWLSDLALSLYLLAFVHAVVQLGGGLGGELYPLVYVLIAFIATFAEKRISSVFLLAAVLYEAGVHFMVEGKHTPHPFVLHALFIAFFGLMNLMFTRVELLRVREKSKRELDEDRERALDTARRFRLGNAASGDGQRNDSLLAQGSLAEVRSALHYTLELLQKALELHSAVLLMSDEGSDEVRVVDVCSSSAELVRGPFKRGEGALGAVVTGGTLTNLAHLKAEYRGLSYYLRPQGVRAFLGLPLIEDGLVRGALCVDRLEDRPFTARDEVVLATAVLHVVRTLANERAFVQLERTRTEKTVLHRASQALGAALTEEAVIEAALSASADIAPFDFAAVTLYDAGERRHSVRRAVGEGAAELKNLSFRDNASLTSMAVQNRHYLPYRGEFDGKRQVVYTRAESMEGMQSLLILPLFVREDPVGTLALAARREGAFGDAERQTLQVLGNQLAVALANAKSVRRLEELATTDGLTGCLNKRAFLDELQKRMRAAERFGRKLSLIVTDIDHFKRVNDTHGHGVGDQVIRGLGEILRALKRETDVVARFGGEEFCILCEETDATGATLLAERVREELKARVFETDRGPLTVTCSLGVAAFPDDAQKDGQLFDVADRALYAAKQSGRDRVCVARKGAGVAP